MSSINLRVVTMPVEVAFTCPECYTENTIDFDVFQHDMYSEYPGDWEGQKLKCEECEKELKIYNVEWD